MASRHIAGKRGGNKTEEVDVYFKKQTGGHAERFSTHRLLLRFALALLALIHAGTCRAAWPVEDWPWIMLVAEHDSRAPDMQRWDEADLRHQIKVFNASQNFVHSHFVFSKIPIAKLLDAQSPFADLHFDSVKPMEFTPEEKTVLKEWLKRGGFLVASEDTYPYEQEEFRKAHNLPVFDFFTKELPAEDPDFTVGKARPDNPIFQRPFPTKPAPPIAVEMRENPNYRGYTTLLYKGRMVVFVMGRYNYMENGRWVPLPRPFPYAHDLLIESYYLNLNVYFQAMSQ